MLTILLNFGRKLVSFATIYCHCDCPHTVGSQAQIVENCQYFSAS